ncbi:CbtA family protein [Pseudomonas sp. CGJS7]|uniref:CbtA family protein n=1 Tax=Pseudomonas sp. CGJS7 TaxID=3109348 RepID=UPI00300B2539
MTGRLLYRGMLAGLLAGLLAFGVAKVIGEPLIERAIALEDAAPHSHGVEHSHEPAAPADEGVSREVQRTLGLFVAIVTYSLAMGGIFALVYAFCMGRIGKANPKMFPVLLALSAFVIIYLVPALKYPPNPPAIGNPETFQERTQLFFLMILVSVVAALIAVNVTRRLSGSMRHGRSISAGVLSYAIIMAVVGGSFPSFSEVPDHFPADLLWDFRLASMGVQAVMWGGIAVAFSLLSDRLLDAVLNPKQANPKRA